MENTIKILEENFFRRYDKLDNLDQQELALFAKEYPLRILEEDILKIAKEYDIEVVPVQTVATEVSNSKNEKSIVITRSISLIDDYPRLHQNEIAAIFTSNLRSLFSKNVGKSFYCLCPLMLDNVHKTVNIFGEFFAA